MGLDILIAAGSAVLGYIMKYNAIVQKNQHDQVMLALQVQRANDDSADKAAKRDGAGGVWVRRLITVVVLGLVSVLAVGGLFTDAIINIPIYHPASSFLIFSKSAYTTYEQVRGAVAFPELFQGFMALIFFYLGAGQAHGK